jgi:hypothetical protein
MNDIARFARSSSDADSSSAALSVNVRKERALITRAKDCGGVAKTLPIGFLAIALLQLCAAAIVNL